MENEDQESYDFECVDCEHQFDASEGDLIGNSLRCPECGSADLLDLCDEG